MSGKLAVGVAMQGLPKIFRAKPKGSDHRKVGWINNSQECDRLTEKCKEVN